MDKASDSIVTAIGIDIGKNPFHLVYSLYVERGPRLLPNEPRVKEALNGP